MARNGIQSPADAAGGSFTQLVKAVAYLRKSVGVAGLSGVGALVGFSIALYGCRAGWLPQKLSQSLLCIACFTLVMILLQQVESRIKNGARQRAARVTPERTRLSRDSG